MEQTMLDELEKFCENYEITVVGNENCVRKHTNAFFSDPKNAAMIQKESVQHTEKLYTLQIPQSRLKTLVEMEKRFFDNQPHHQGYTDMFELLMAKEREESHFRQSSEAVRTAYENYSMMLYMAGYHKKI